MVRSRVDQALFHMRLFSRKKVQICHDDQVASTLLCDNDSPGSVAVPLEVISSGLIPPKARFSSMPGVVPFLYSTKVHFR